MKTIIKEALSDKNDNEISPQAARLRRRFCKAAFKNLLGMTVKQAQKKVFK